MTNRDVDRYHATWKLVEIQNMIADESKMCFMTVANKPYQRYVPWFLYFLNRAYPQAHKLILLDEKVTPDIQQMLTLLSGNFEVREHAFPEYTKADANTIKCLRWLTFEPVFEQYDCMSIGDVDMAICMESPPYMDQHLLHCEQVGIPYSNFIRSANAGPRRMCGIHVIKPREWFVVMRPIIDKYRFMFKENSINSAGKGFNEQLLLRMITESELGEPPPNLSKIYWSSLVTSSHHGIHIRLAEHNQIRELQSVRGYLTHKSEILATVQTPLFKQLSKMSPQIGGILESIARAYENF